MPDIVNHPTSNALNSGAPQTGADNMPQQGGNALAMPGGDATAGQPMQAPAPTQEQTVSALIHFERLTKDFGKLLADPEIGKKDMKRSIYDTAAGLLGDGFSTLPALMGELNSIPKEPDQQYKWIQQHFNNARQAMAKVFADHLRANPDAANAPPLPPRDHSKHTHVMAGLATHYKSRTRA